MKLTLSIPDDLYDAYVAQAGGEEKGVRSLIIDRLHDNKDRHGLSLAVELTETQRARLQEIFDKTIATGADVMQACEDVVRFDFGGFAYDFKLEDLEILQSQAYYWEKPLDEYIRDGMEQFVQYMTNQS